MSLQRGANAAFVVRLLLQRQAHPPPPRHAYNTSTISAFSIPSSLTSISAANSTAAPAGSFLEEENATEYEIQRSALAERVATVRPIPWPTIFEPKKSAGSADENLACTPLWRCVLSQDWEGAMKLYGELRQAGVYIQPRPEYMHAARRQLLRATPDRDAFLAFLSIVPHKMALPEDIVSHIRRNCTRDVNLIRQVILNLADRQRMGRRCMTLVNHLALVAKPELTLVTFIEALDRYREAGKKYPDDHVMGHEWKSHLWNVFIRRMISVGHRKEATQVYDKLSLQNPPILWEELTVQMVKPPAFGPIEYSPGKPSPVDTPARWLIKRMRYASKHRMTPTNLLPILKDLSALNSTHPSLYSRFRSSFVQPRITSVGSDGEEGLWTAEQARRVWIQAEIMMLQGQGRHAEAVSYFRGHCLWHGLALHPAIKKLPIAANNFGREVRPNIHMINIILESVLEILPRSRDEVRYWHDHYLHMVPKLAPAVRPNTYTHGRIALFMANHFGMPLAVEMLRKTVSMGIPVGTDPFEKLVLLAARSGFVFEKFDGLLQAMENGTEWAGMYPGKPSADFHIKLRKALKAGERWKEVHDARKQRINPWPYRAVGWPASHGLADSEAQPIVSLRQPLLWEPESLELDDDDGHVREESLAAGLAVGGRQFGLKG